MSHFHFGATKDCLNFQGLCVLTKNRKDNVMVPTFVKIEEAKQKSGFLNSYKVENALLEAAAACQQQGTTTMLQTACLDISSAISVTAKKGGVVSTELLFLQNSSESTCFVPPKVLS